MRQVNERMSSGVTGAVAFREVNGCLKLGKGLDS